MNGAGMSDADAPTGMSDETTAAAAYAADAEAAGRKATIVAAVLLVLLLTLTGLFIWFLWGDDARTAKIRDIVIILVASLTVLINIAIGGVLIVLLYRLQDLTKVLRNEIQPTLAEISSTVRTVAGTARMVSDQVAKPAIKAAGFFAGLQGAARAARRKFDERRGGV
jgi:hypothetical protein